MSSIIANAQILSDQPPAQENLPWVTLRKSGTILEISTNAAGPPPEEAVYALEPQLRYTKIEYLFGAEKWDPITGQKRNVRTIPKQLYRYDERGRMVCGFGLYRRVYDTLRDAGFGVRFINKDPLPKDRARPRCYEPDWTGVENKFHFYPRQRECLENIANNPCGIVHAVTGFGKMIMIAMVCVLYPHAKIDIITRRKDLVNKLRITLTKWIPNVGQVGGGLRRYGRVTVYTAASLHHCPFDADIVLGDEGHELIADDASKWLAKYRYTRNYFFTASPEGRTDGTDIRMESLVGGKIFYISYPEAVKLGLVVPIRVEWANIHMDSNPCSDMEGVTKERWGIWRNAWRNSIIAQKAQSFGEDEQVQILVKTVEHAVYLRQHLPEFTLVYDQMEMENRTDYIRLGLLSADEPEMTPARREALRQAFERGELKKAISTNIWAVGIDAVQLTALIRADAAASEIMDIQAPGRVSRTHSAAGKEVGIVCDFRDQFDLGFTLKARKRIKHYRAMGWSQVLVPADQKGTSENAVILE